MNTYLLDKKKPEFDSRGNQAVPMVVVMDSGYATEKNVKPAVEPVVTTACFLRHIPFKNDIYNQYLRFADGTYRRAP